MVDYVPKLIKAENKLISLFKSNKIVHDNGKKLSRPKTQKESEDKIIKNVIDYIEYESNGDRNKNQTINKYLDQKIKPYLKNIIIDL